jgi:hypothetical protein
MAAQFPGWGPGSLATRCSQRTTSGSPLPFLLLRARINNSLTSEPVRFDQLFGQHGAFAFARLFAPARPCISITLNAPRIYRALLQILAIYDETQVPLGQVQWRDGATRNLSSSGPAFSTERFLAAEKRAQQLMREVNESPAIPADLEVPARKRFAQFRLSEPSKPERPISRRVGCFVGDAELYQKLNPANPISTGVPNV